MSFINDSILLLINVLHIIVIIFVLCAPFSGSNYLLFMHTIIVPFIMLHWVLNNNTCSLTVMEKFVRTQTYGVQPEDEECFSYKFIAPIYDFNKNTKDFSNFTYIITIGLWFVSIYSFIYKFKNNEINSLLDIFKM
jgi:hypothetical protein